MGFIDWHGKKIDRGKKVEQYIAQIKENERILTSEAETREWLSATLGTEIPVSFSADDCATQMISEYKHARETYIRITNQGETATNLTHLWVDLWVLTVIQVLNPCQLLQQKKERLLQAIIDGVFGFPNEVRAEEYYTLIEESFLFFLYLHRSFSLDANKVPEFWRWLWEASNGIREQYSDFLHSYSRFIAFLTAYLNLLLHFDYEWLSINRGYILRVNRFTSVYQHPDNREVIIRYIDDPRRKKQPRRELCFSKAVPFAKASVERRVEWDMMAEEFISEIQEKRLIIEQIDSILPEDILAQISDGMLPSFLPPELSGLSVGEKVHYMDHATLFVWNNVELSYVPNKGTLFLTDQKIYFTGTEQFELAYPELVRVTKFDCLPAILEVASSDESYLIYLPSIEEAYSVLWLLANPTPVSPPTICETPLTYEELVEKADLKACIFALDYLTSVGCPVDLAEKVDSLLTKMRGLDRTIEKYPDKAGDIKRFLSYYIPETIRVTQAYQQYMEAEVQSKTMVKLRSAVYEAVETMDSAVEKKIIDFYGFASMNTLAQAEALRDVLGQDGYSKDKSVLKH